MYDRVLNVNYSVFDPYPKELIRINVTVIVMGIGIVIETVIVIVNCLLPTSYCALLLQ